MITTTSVLIPLTAQKVWISDIKMYSIDACIVESSSKVWPLCSFSSDNKTTRFDGCRSISFILVTYMFSWCSCSWLYMILTDSYCPANETTSFLSVIWPDWSTCTFCLCWHLAPASGFTFVDEWSSYYVIWFNMVIIYQRNCIFGMQKLWKSVSLWKWCYTDIELFVWSMLGFGWSTWISSGWWKIQTALV